MTLPSINRASSHNAGAAAASAGQPPETRWIASNEELAAACAKWRSSPLLAVDTEFVRERTFRPILGLIQIADEEGVTLIDPLEVEQLAPLAELLVDKAIDKIFHSCSEDLEVFRERLGIVATPIFDSQLAAAFAGYGYSLGYSRLIDALFGIALPKTETRSDWLRRPLSAAQLEYAALDVAHLPAAYHRLKRELEEKGRLEIFREDCARITEEASRPEDREAAYRKIAASRLWSRRELGLLYELVRWREEEARRRDLPRNFVLPEAAVPVLAQLKPSTMAQLAKVEVLKGRDLSRLAPKLLELIATALQIPAEELPEPFPRPLDVQPYKATLQNLRAALDKVAAEENLPAELLANRRSLESLIRRYLQQEEQLLPRKLRGWREQLLGPALVQVLEVDLSRLRQAKPARPEPA
jgi:ribonuclease D